MQIQLIHDTDTGKTQVHLVGVSWGVNEPPEGTAAEGSKMLVFGAPDDSLDVIIPVGPNPAKEIASRLITKPAAGVVKATVSDIAAVRNGRGPHGS